MTSHICGRRWAALATLLALPGLVGGFGVGATPARADGASALAPEPQVQAAVAVVSGFPAAPSPSAAFDWAQRALDFDEFIYTWDESRGAYQTILLDEDAPNMDGGDSYKIPAYYGDARVSLAQGQNEAIAQIASVVSASLVGVDKSNQDGWNYVDMLRTFYHPDLGVALNTNKAGQGPGNEAWYTTTANLLYSMLGQLYPDATDMDTIIQSIADSYYDMVVRFGGAAADFGPNNYDFKSETPSSTKGYGGPESAAGTAAIELWAYERFGDEKYLQGAKWAMDYLERQTSSVFYEWQIVLAPYVAARLNAQHGTEYDVSKYFAWLISGSTTRGGWGTMTGKWGAYDVSGVMGSVTDSIGGVAGYGFAMNTFQVPLMAAAAKYDARYANAIGKWVLNAANAGRYFFPDQVPASDQQYGDRFIDDPAHVIAHEGLWHTAQGVKAGGDIPSRSSGWGGLGEAATSLGIYGSAWIGMMGATVQATNVANVLRIDLNALDFYGQNDYPTYLYHNPGAAVALVDVAVDGVCDLYDAVSGAFLARNVSGTAVVEVPAGGSVVLVHAPAGATLTVEGHTTYLDGVAAGHNAMPSRDLALGRDAIIAAAAEGTVAATTDGDPATTWTLDSDHPVVEVELAAPAVVDQIVAEWAVPEVGAHTISVSADGADWQDVATSDAGGLETLTFTARTVSKVRVELLEDVAELGELRVHLESEPNLALNKSATASGSNSAGQPSAMLDGSMSTRWESNTADNAWAIVDLGAVHPISLIRLNWEGAYSKEYRFEVSTDGANWTTVVTETNGHTGWIEHPLAEAQDARHVKWQGVKRGTTYANSIFELEIYAAAHSTNLALGRAVRPSNEADQPAPEVTDGKVATAREIGAGQLVVDLGAERAFNQIQLTWAGGAVSHGYRLAVSDNALNWTDIAVTASAPGGVETVVVKPVTARHILLQPDAADGPALADLQVHKLNLALNAPVTVSSTNAVLNAASNATDGTKTTSWISQASDPQQLVVDLGGPREVGSVVVSWGGTCFRTYTIAVSTDGLSWETVASEVSRAGETLSLFAPTTASHVRVHGSQRSNSCAYNIAELAVYAPESIPAATALQLSATVGVKCIAGKAYLTVTAQNDSDVAAALTVTTPYGVKVFPSIAPGASGFHSFTTRLASYTAVPVTVTGAALAEPERTGVAAETTATASCGG
ncbi:MAG: discoidin domain-containing protein [Bifidobacteriaceae bacterium]|jgi:hypothetical protein|nr:discoidin domain-containing protein [Bifidobacteriaceae bacterium]